MSSIGVDFKLKYVEVDGKKIKLQIVLNSFLLLVGHCWTRTIQNDYDELL